MFQDLNSSKEKDNSNKNQASDPKVKEEAQYSGLIQPFGNEALNQIMNEPLIDVLPDLMSGGPNSNAAGNNPGNKKNPDSKQKGKHGQKKRYEGVSFVEETTYAPDLDMMVETDENDIAENKDISDRYFNRLPETSVEGANEVTDAVWKRKAQERLQNKKIDSPEGEEAFRSQEMEKLKNWNFTAQRMNEIPQPGKVRRFLTFLATGIGKLFKGLAHLVTAAPFVRLKSAIRFLATDTDKWQDKKDYQNIPGWFGAKYDPNATSGADVMADFRRVPTVWSRLTADRASEPVTINGEKTEKPLDPVVSVMADQPVSGSSQTMDRGIGHTMICIEYSRKSLLTGRYERYKLKYGFYPAGSLLSTISTKVNLGKNDAVLPGELVDDYKHPYDISRSYHAKPEQVNEILKASEKYAEGGYSYYNRNCTTFVKEMIVDTAHLATGGEIFKQADVEFNHMANAGMFLGEIADQNIKAGTETLLMDLAQKEDETYQNYGNKRATKLDWANYKQSMKQKTSVIKETFIPAITGERMRRMKGDEAGEIGSFKFSGDDDEEKKLDFDGINDAIRDYGTEVKNQYIDPLLSQDDWKDAPNELISISRKLHTMGSPLMDVKKNINDKVQKLKDDDEEDLKLEDYDFEDYVELDVLRKARADLSDNIAEINVVLNNYFKNDKRIHHPLVNLISLLNHGVLLVDELYEKTIEQGKKGPGNLRQQLTKRNIDLESGDISLRVPATHYESYIQIYKDPKIAIKNLHELNELRKQKEEDTLDPADEKKLAKLERLDALANEFDNAHRYMIEKSKFNQQDIDYAFRLHKLETKGLEQTEEGKRKDIDRNKEVRDEYRSASGIYITLFMDDFFSGIKTEWKKKPEEGGMEENDFGNVDAVKNWLDLFLTKQIKAKENDFQNIIRGIYRSIQAEAPDKEVDEKDVLSQIAEVIRETIINRYFSTWRGFRKDKEGARSLVEAISEMGKKTDSQFSKLITVMARVCRMEDTDKLLTRK